MNKKIVLILTAILISSFSFALFRPTCVFASSGMVNVSFIDLSGGGSNIVNSENTLTISKDIILDDGDTLVMYVNGNVVIDKEVSVLKSVYIIATGTISTVSDSTSESSVDKSLQVFGGLYGKNINFNRDVKDTGTFEYDFRPSTQVLFDPSIIVKANNGSGGIPAETGVSNVYWSLKE